MTIKGKVALVTGAGQGIGRGIALRLAKDGADIAVVDINTDKMAEVAAEIEELGRKATTFKADVSARAEVYAAVEHTEKTLGGLDIMVNNAGIAQVDPRRCNTGGRRAHPENQYPRCSLGDPGCRCEIQIAGP